MSSLSYFPLHSRHIFLKDVPLLRPSWSGLGVQLTSGFLGYPNRDVLLGDMAASFQPDSPHSRRIPSHTQ